MYLLYPIQFLTIYPIYFWNNPRAIGSAPFPPVWILVAADSGGRCVCSCPLQLLKNGSRAHRRDPTRTRGLRQACGKKVMPGCLSVLWFGESLIPIRNVYFHSWATAKGNLPSFVFH